MNLIDIDKKISIAINSLHSEWLDFVMYWLSDRLIWLPLYLLLIGLLILKYRKNVWIWLLALTVMIILSDQACNIFKMGFERLRPCQDLTTTAYLHMLDGICHGKYGFVSGHAANSFAIATFTSLVLGKHYKILKWIMFVWASLIAYSRVYLAAHFLGDVLCGGILGVLIALLVVGVFNFLSSKLKITN